MLNYREENITERVKVLTDNQGVDHIVEVEFGGNLPISQEIIKLNGCIAAYASEGNPNPQIPFYHVLFKGVTLHFVNVYELSSAARFQAINDINSMLESNTLKHAIAACNNFITYTDGYLNKASGDPDRVIVRPNPELEKILALDSLVNLLLL